MSQAIFSYLDQGYPWRDRLYVFDSIGSTNDHLRTLAEAGAPHGTAVLAKHQTNGHGRRGRSFHSPEGMGVYLSILLRPCCSPAELMHLTCAAGVSMCDAVEDAAGFRPGIKWTNDLVFGKRKLGGILTALSLHPDGRVKYAIVGIGINCLQTASDFPEDIRQIAGSLAMVTGKPVNTDRMAAAMLNRLWGMDRVLLTEKDVILHRYRADCMTLGQQVALVRGDEKRYGHALDIDEEGALVVEFDNGQVEAVNSGEISVRGMYGYV